MSHTPPEPGSPASSGTRRAFLVGSTAGIAGTAIGAGAGRVLFPPRAPDPLPPVEVEKPLPVGTKLSYAQFGEDLVANSLLAYMLKIDKPTYLDIGAWDPINSNNTYFFYHRGARGVVVEPTPQYAEKLKQVRPEDKVLGIGIGITDATEMDFYVMSEAQQNTFDKAHAEKFVKERGYKIERVIKIPLVNINRVMAEHFGGAAPDYLSIDVEGLEFEIAKTIDFDKFRPKVICVETLVANTNRHNPAIAEFMASKGYEVRGRTFPNTFFMDRSLLSDKDSQ